MANKEGTKTTLAVSLDLEVIKKIKEIAQMEERSVSKIVQRALVHYLHRPTIENEVADNEQRAIDHLVNRITAAVSSPDVSRNGVTPAEIRIEDGGQIVIRLQTDSKETSEAVDRMEEQTLENFQLL